MSVYVNANPGSELQPRKEYFGNYLGIVVQNNDPDKGGKVKIWVPHISPTVYENWDEKNEDKSFTFQVKSAPASVLIKKAAGISKGSGEPNREKVGSITRAQLEEIVTAKQKDLNANDMDQAVKIIAGTARSMGVEVK